VLRIVLSCMNGTRYRSLIRTSVVFTTQQIINQTTRERVNYGNYAFQGSKIHATWPKGFWFAVAVYTLLHVTTYWRGWEVFVEWVTTYLEQRGCTWKCVSDARYSFHISRCLSHTRIAQITLVSVHRILFVESRIQRLGSSVRWQRAQCV